jgi:hypothetical protein
MGVVGLGVGLWVYYSRERPTPPEGDAPPPTAATPPAQLAGLGYLPADTNIAFAVQPGPVLAYAARTNQDPGELITRAGFPPRVLGLVGELGLTLPQIDHLAGGTTLGDATFDPRLTLALVLRRPPADEDEFLQKLKAKKLPGGKERYDAELAGLPFVAARVSPTVWVFGLALGSQPQQNLAAADRGGYGPGGTQFRKGLSEMIDQRVPPDAAAWLATDDDRWADKPGVKFIAEVLFKKPEWLATLARGRAGMGSVSFGDPPRVRLFVKTADDATGQRVRDFFRERAASDDRAQVGGAGDLAFLDTPIDPANAFVTLQQFLSDVKK